VLGTAAGLLIGGCAGDGSAPRQVNWVVPDSAEIAAQGKLPLSFLVSRSGMLYIYDQDTKSLIYSGEMRDDDQVLIQIDPEQKAITAQGSMGEPVTLVKKIDPKDRYSMYFVPAGAAAPPGTQAAPASDGRTIQRR
jgi:hypothetical protein